MYLFAEDIQEVPLMVEDIRAAAQRIAANCREARFNRHDCPHDCPGLMACAMAGAAGHPHPSPPPLRGRE